VGGRLATDETNLGNLVTNGVTALGVTAAHSMDLGNTFANAPAALAQTQQTMVRLRTTLNILDPIAQQLEPGAQKLYRAATLARAAVTDARPLLVDLKPTLNAIRPSVVSLASTARAGTPVINSLTSTVNRVQNTFIPWLNQTESGTGLTNYEDVGPTLAAVASVIAYGDKYGGLAGFEAGAGEGVLNGISPCQTQLTNPNPTQLVACQGLTAILGSIFGGQPVSAAIRNLADKTLVAKLLGIGGVK
jgi:ABC-type transporter Mla subunit MlaD